VKMHLSELDIEAYRSRSAAPERLLAMNDHLFKCDQCLRMLDSPSAVARAYRAFRKFLSPEPRWQEHLDYEQLERFVDGTASADTTRQVLAHIADCAECRGSIRDLRELKERIESQAGTELLAVKRPGVSAWWQLPRYRLAFGLTTFLVVLAGMLGIFIHRKQSQIGEKKGRGTEEIAAKLPATSALLLQDGNHQIRRAGTGQLLGLDLLPTASVSALNEALNTGRLPVPAAPETTLGKVGTLLGTGEREKGFDVVYPANIVVEDTQPSFEWRQLAGATGYVVMIKDLASGAETESSSLDKTSWKPEVPLARGHQYAWMVEAAVDSSRVRAPAPDKPFATFIVLDEQQADGISQARKLYGDSHLGMGLAYAKAGLLREAEYEFSQLAAANPDSQLARNLLASVARKSSQ
jgi:hypothetical protein